MSNTWKKFLLPLIVLAVLGGVIYLGRQIFTQPTSTVTTTTEQGSITTTTKNEDFTPTEFEKCETSEQCKIISEVDKSDSDKSKTIISCLNESYLDSCTDCSTNESLTQETLKEATCGCVNNFCQLDPITQ
jgi:hypothetical protein